MDFELEGLMQSKSKSDNSFEKLSKLNRKLVNLIDINALIVSSLDKEHVLKTILQQTKLLMECKEASIQLVDEEKQELYFALLSDHDDAKQLANIRLKMGEGIAGKVWEDRKPIVISKNVTNSHSPTEKTKSSVLAAAETLVAIPLFVQGAVIGVMEAVNKKGEESFSDTDVELFMMLGNLAAVAIHNAMLYEMATRDGLTKLYLRRYYDSRLSQEFSRVNRYGGDLSLIMFDIDHFKQINDSYGHQCGDAVLQRVAGILMENSRDSDIPARYGGEEFSVILPLTSIQGAFCAAERVRRSCEECELVWEGERVSFTISAGVASLLGNRPKSASDLIVMADSALYKAKEVGRNKAILCEGKE